MASKGPDEGLIEEVICHVCLDFFTDPVTLECGHSFCRSCITRFWEREERNSCPECRAQFADRTLRSSRLLARLAEKARKLHLKPRKNENKLHCEEHEEEMKLFCETDKKLICVICAVSQEHREHRFLSIKEAVELCKDQIKSSIESLTKKKSDFQQMEKQQIQKISGVREEDHQKSSVGDEAPVLSVTDGTLTMEKFDHLFSLKTLLKETYVAIKQVSVTLDVETAGPGLEVSADRKKVKWTRSPPHHPDTEKRFTVGACVLGSEGFTSGRHYWEVDVAGNRRWRLGVAAESVERKSGVKLKTDNGFWIIWRRDDELNVNTSPPTRLPVDRNPGRVGVYLSYETGTVSFYNAETKTHLHTFTGSKFTGKLYPFFGTVDENKWVRICSVPLRICKRDGSRHPRQMLGSGAVENIGDNRLALKGSFLIPKFHTVVIQ
ncbi:E3 ubiquitin-protein ligase TRIM39-like isoform X3 [Hypanus sabinus]|uniref:E3 ubiquitin-protein ligase TRIM39-like isoform X3 n=1 Tax=Hypanus sabinus TaxID=79690 RepID=UPI0028C47197|nr:E3 ubiquitin-protein ligase TRIM39-like isoform X3 [Hypanus sabinus]